MLEEASRIRTSTCLLGARGRGEAGSDRLERYLRAPENCPGPPGSGAPRGAARTAGAPLRKPGYLQPAGVPSGTGAASAGSGVQWVPRGGRVSAPSLLPGERQPCPFRRRRQLKSIYRPALRFSSCSENRPRPALQPRKGTAGGLRAGRGSPRAASESKALPPRPSVLPLARSAPCRWP